MREKEGRGMENERRTTKGQNMSILSLKRYKGLPTVNITVTGDIGIFFS